MNDNIPDRARTLRRLRRLARLMDSTWRVPLVGWRFGLDPVLGLLPGGGDAAGLAVGAYIVYQAKQMGAPPELLARMAANIALDSLLGSVPVLGDLFDAVFKANTRNIDLLERWAGVTGQQAPAASAPPASPSHRSSPA